MVTIRTVLKIYVRSRASCGGRMSVGGRMSGGRTGGGRMSRGRMSSGGGRVEEARKNKRRW